MKMSGSQRNIIYLGLVQVFITIMLLWALKNDVLTDKKILSRTLTENVQNLTADDNKPANDLEAELFQLHAQRLAVMEQNSVRRASCGGNCAPKSNFSIPQYAIFQQPFPIAKEPFSSWTMESSKVHHCDDQLVIFYRKFALLRGVTLHAYRRKGLGQLKGGEDILKVRFQEEEKEVIKMEKGLWELKCNYLPGVIDKLAAENIPWLDVTSFKLGSPYVRYDRRKDSFVANFTIAIAREDYANLFHSMLHMYNIFTMLMIFKQQPTNLTILILDAHPRAEIDSTYETLFGPLIRLGRINNPLLFDTLVWSPTEKQSPLSKYKEVNLPYLEEFRQFFFNQHSLNETSELTCSKLRITIIWRRYSVYHPRNLQKPMERIIFNEAELFSAIYNAFPDACVHGVLLETMPMREQIRLIKSTDILVGMHGAGLTHTLFLPKHAGIVEMFPHNWRKHHSYYPLFEAMARWRKLLYLFYENNNPKREISHSYTVVDTDAVVQLIRKINKVMCYSNRIIR